MKEKLEELKNTIETYLTINPNNKEKEGIQTNTIEEVTIREEELSITKINTKESSEYYILDKRVIPTFLVIDNLDWKESYFQITIEDEVQIIKIGEVRNSKTFINYFEELNNWMTNQIEGEKRQVK